MYKLLIKGLRQIVQVTDDPDVEFIRGQKAMNNIKILNSDKNDLAILIDNEGNIAAIGTENEVNSQLSEAVEETINTQGGVALPGFVDGHSHPVFAGDRVHEFAMKLAGATYMEVQAAGGGIHFTTTKTREASEEQLLEDFLQIAKNMINNGTTTLEAKSGYGLETESELKMLRVLAKAAKLSPLEISATFCGAHAVPKGSTEDKQTELICNEIIPKILEEKKNGGLENTENIDVFCEKGNFLVESTKKILLAGQKAGLAANFHAEELSWIGGTEMGAEIGARAMSHLEEISPAGISAMASSGSVAVLLPSTAFILRLTPPPARKLIENNVIIALGSDFNPNAFCFAMPMIMHLACVTMRLSMSEALVAATLNSAHSIGRGKTHGALAKGRKGDIVILDANSWEHIIYRMAAQSMIIRHVIKGDMKLLIFIGIALTCASPIISNNENKQISALEEEKIRLREEYASFNGTELENLGKDTYFYGLSDLQGPLILMQFLEYGNFNYQQFASSVHRDQKIRRMIEDLKFAKDKRHLFESYGKVYQEIASRGVELF